MALRHSLWVGGLAVHCLGPMRHRSGNHQRRSEMRFYASRQQNPRHLEEELGFCTGCLCKRVRFLPKQCGHDGLDTAYIMQPFNAESWAKEQKKEKKKYLLKKLKYMFPLSKPATSIYFPIATCPPLQPDHPETKLASDTQGGQFRVTSGAFKVQVGETREEPKEMQRKQLAGVKPRDLLLRIWNTHHQKIFKTSAVNLINCAQAWPNTPHCLHRGITDFARDHIHSQTASLHSARPRLISSLLLPCGREPVPDLHQSIRLQHALHV